MGAVDKFIRTSKERRPAEELPQQLLKDAERPEQRYLGTPLLELLTSQYGQCLALDDRLLPLDPVKDQWPIQLDHAEPLCNSL